MPELPEVETVVRQLAQELPGRRILRAQIRDPLLGTPPVQALGSRSIEDVFRRGKLAVLQVGPGARSIGPLATSRQLWLAVHLRMTGRLIWMPRTDVSQLPRPHHRAQIQTDGGTLFFVDTRRFGTLTVHTSLAELEPRGEDPTGPGFTVARLRALLDGSGQALKAWLLRQDRLVGLGNIYACEILFAARLDPQRSAGSLDAQQSKRLHGAIREVLQQAIAHCGTTFSDFQDAHGVTGSYQRYLKVYGKEGDPCAACGRPIARLVQQQRSTFHCPTCQK